MNAVTQTRRNRAATANEAPHGAEPANSTETETENTGTAPKHDIPSQTVRRVQNVVETDVFAIATPSNRMGEKNKLLATVRPMLDQLVGLQNADNEESERLENQVETTLFQGLVQGLLSFDEANVEVGRAYGFQKKGDSKSRAANSSEASKTPFGYGKSLRDRLQRGYKAYQFANSDWEGDNFFRPMDKDEVADIIAPIVEGETGEDGNPVFGSVFTVYNDLQNYAKELKADAPDRVDPAFDPKRIAKLVGSLTEDGAEDVFAANPVLIAAYGGLMEAIRNLNARLMERDDAADIIEAVRHAPALEVA